jgi:hypothetical protein
MRLSLSVLVVCAIWTPAPAADPARPNVIFLFADDLDGGFPWIGETGVIVMRHGSHVWIDSAWLPTLSYTMAKRAFHEWLEVMPSNRINRIMWGADCFTKARKGRTIRGGSRLAIRRPKNAHDEGSK